MPETLAEWLTHIDRLHAQPIALGLERVKAVACRLGVEQRVPVITVGGTNGKGSTCAMLEQILLSAGYRVGLYTSPHLLVYNERVRVDGRPADDLVLCRSFAEVEQARGGTSLTYFEFGTLGAWQTFARAKVDAVILEVGLGGRLDAVNAFDTDCAVLTSIDIDHTDYLGHTRDAIGLEKAGIFRAGIPAIVGDAHPPASLVDYAHQSGADLQILGRDFGYQSDASQWNWWGRRGHPGAGVAGRRNGLAHPALRGSMQLVNASVAISVLETLRQHLPVSMQDIRRGLLEVELPGRFQVLPGRPVVILDVGHNPQAAGVLAENLGGMGFHPHTYAVFGMLRDKDIGGVVERVKGRVDFWLAASLEGPRGTSAEELAAILFEHGVRADGLFASPGDALRAAKARAGEDDRILAFGSFLTVADAMRAAAAEKR
jgi:dihydrofolate synthase/folylpolyglutamate synthase